jgi:hypothetical protein
MCRWLAYAGHVRSPLFFAHLRAAIGSAVQQTNCHPFKHGRWLWMHNGFIADLAKIKRDLVLVVSEPIGDLPGPWVEVPEATYGVHGNGEDRLLPFTVTPRSAHPNRMMTGT